MTNSAATANLRVQQHRAHGWLLPSDHNAMKALQQHLQQSPVQEAALQRMRTPVKAEFFSKATLDRLSKEVSSHHSPAQIRSNDQRADGSDASFLWRYVPHIVVDMYLCFSC